MNQIEKLIEELCPDGVEYKPLGSLGVRNKGIPITAKKMRDIADNTGDIKIFAGGKTSVQAQSTSIESKGIIYKPSIIVKSRGYIGFEYYDQPFTHKSELWSYSINENGNINQKFVFYYLTTKSPQLQEYARATSVKIPQLSVKDTDTLPIPIPPLVIQNEIVKILDTFQSLEAELEAELEARKKQYEFYRDNLMSELAIRYPTLKIHEIANVQRGQSMTAKRAIPGEFPVIANGPDPVYTHNHFNRDGENVVIARSGAKAGLVSFWTGKFFLTDAFSFQAHRDVISSRFLYYFLQSRQDQIDSNRRGAGVPHVRISEVEQSEIPIPPLEEQQRIVNILDKFDALVNDLTSGLPAEIEARRKQYEFYRDQLLTFKELSA